jgi:hypothetical protein
MSKKQERKVDPDRKLGAEELRAMRKQRGLSVDEPGALVNYSGGTITMIGCTWRSPVHLLARCGRRRSPAPPPCDWPRRRRNNGGN